MKNEKWIVRPHGQAIRPNTSAQSLYRSCAGSHFYGTEYKIWADFRSVGNTGKKVVHISDCLIFRYFLQLIFRLVQQTSAAKSM